MLYFIIICVMLSSKGKKRFEMATRITKYNNEMNKIPFKNYTAIEMDLLMTICSLMREQGTSSITFSFEKLQALSKYDRTQNTEKFIKDVVGTYEKLLKLPFRLDTDNSIIYFVLFTAFKVDRNAKSVKIAVNEEFKWVLNDLNSQFTHFELNEFLNLNGKYTKDIYRFCKQFRATGQWHVTIEDFRKWLDIPKSYNMGMIEKQILKPAKEELDKICNYFEYTKKFETQKEFVPGQTLKGRKAVTSLHFKFEFKHKDIVYVDQEDDEVVPIFPTPKIEKRNYLEVRTRQKHSKKQNIYKDDYAPNVKNFEERPFQAVDEHPDYWKRFELDDEEDV